eukprot:COSAG06_NODE_244_length_19215_cov_20.256853_11_plen_109_part_00
MTVTQNEQSLIRYGQACESEGLSTFVHGSAENSVVACSQFTCVKMPTSWSSGCCDGSPDAIYSHTGSIWPNFVYGAGGWPLGDGLHGRGGGSANDVSGTRRVICALEH